MLLPKERIFYLLDAYVSRRATPAEEDELMEWMLKAGEDAELKDFVLDVWNQQHAAQRLSATDWDSIFDRVLKERKNEPQPARIRKMRSFRIAAAAAAIAAVLTVVLMGYYFSFTRDSAVAVIQPPVEDIIAPSENKAVLTLADGTRIELGSADTGTIAMQDGVTILKQPNGSVVYAGSVGKTVGYNTFGVPRGSKPLSIVLADGTRVWLNVGSSLTYPTAFTGKERKVSITGEAYFEVAHNAAMPFKVQHNDVIVSVLGTHFNVNTYEDETAERITLLEGSVLVSKKNASKLLQPGQQASVNHDEVGEIKVSSGVDLDEVMAWKEGKFRFGESMDIGTIMRQISRWYDVQVEYKAVVNQRFLGAISKDVNLSQVLKILEATGGVQFSMQGNKIVVMPGPNQASPSL